jgi:hypothetical protein
MTASNIDYQIGDRTRATVHGGIGAIHLLVRKLGLDQAIDRSLGSVQRTSSSRSSRLASSRTSAW